MNEQEQTIDLRVLLAVLISHIIPIILVTVIGAASGYSVAKFGIPKRYASEALMYVENSASKQDDAAINVNDINAAQKLVNTCQILFTSDELFYKLGEQFNGAYSNKQLSNMIKIESVNNTEVLRITVQSGSPDDSYKVACALIALATDEFHRIIKGGSIETVSNPTIPLVHNYPSTTRFAMIGALVGLVVSYGFFLVKELLDTKVKADDDLTAMYDLPVFAEILDFETAGRSGYKYGKYGRYGKYSNYSSYENDPKKEDSLYAGGLDVTMSRDASENDKEEDESRGKKK